MPIVNENFEYISTYFGKIDLKKLEAEYESEIKYKGKPLEISMTFLSEKKQTSIDELQKIDFYLDNVSQNLNGINRILIDDYKQEETVKEYIDFLTEELEEEDLLQVMENHNASLSIEHNILLNINLLRIVFYPDQEDDVFAIFDYTLSQDITDVLLVARLNNDNSLNLLIES
ncbi:MAG: DUF2004 domain-containing protein [Bacteroidota bacterium]